MKGYFIQFFTPTINDPSCYKIFQNLFGNYGEVIKLYIDYNNKFGKVYYKEKEDADLAFQHISLENSFCMQLQPPELEKFIKHIDPNNSIMEDEVETSVGSVMYDIYGNEIDTLLSDVGEIYVPLSCISKIGFYLYDEKKLRTLKEGNTQVIYDNFKAYLNSQAHIYMNINKIKLKPSDVMKSIEETIEQVTTDRNNAVKSLSGSQRNSMNGMSSRVNSLASVASGDGQERIIHEYQKLQLEVNNNYKVIVCSPPLQNEKYFVRLFSNISTYDSILAEVNVAAMSAKSFYPAEKAVCASFFRQKWRRVYVIQINPINVVFIDEGNHYKGDLELRPLPEKLQKIPGQAVRIKCSNNDDPALLNNQLLNIFVVKRYEDSTCLVRPTILNETFPTQIGDRLQNENRNTSASPRNNRISFTNEDANKGSRNNSFTHGSQNQSNNTPDKSFQSRNNSFSKSQLNITPDKASFGNTQSFQSRNNSFTKGSQNELTKTPDKANVETMPAISLTGAPVKYQATFKAAGSSSTSTGINSDKSGVKIPFGKKSDTQLENNSSSSAPTPMPVVSKAPTPKSVPSAAATSKPVPSAAATSKPVPSAAATPILLMNAVERKNISECIKGEAGYVQCMEKVSTTSFIAFIFTISKTADIEMLEGLGDDINQTENYVATPGETIAVKTDVEEVETWVRGTVLNITHNTYKLALIDYGKTITSNKVYKLPEKYLKLPEFSALCKGDATPIQKLEVGECYNLTSSENFKLQIVYDESTNSVFEASCEKIVYDSPTVQVQSVPEQIIVTKIPATKSLNINDLVMIINEDKGVLSCRTRGSSMILKELLSQAMSQKIEPLTKKPIVNQLVFHKLDNEPRRSVIEAFNNNNTIRVLHIDYGTTFNAPVEALFYIHDYCNIEGTINFMNLKGFENGFSEKALDYIRKCIKQTKFTLSYIQNDVIDLNCKDGQLSNILTELDKPVFKTLSDMKFGEIPIGGTVELLAVCMDQLDEGVLKFYPSNQTITDQFVTLSSDLFQCESGPIPKVLHQNEICVAHFEGEWYRAVVEKANPETNEYLVNYLDFGNKATISLQDTRVIEDKFLEFPIITIECMLKDILDKHNGVIPKAVFNKLIEIVETEMYEVKVLSKDGTRYNVCIPSLTSQL